ncbi:MAG: tryptophan-rich sensory protein [Idiomarina sp.]|nr:tryptophan-rich sensory protein [Idiomarina sp.]
MSYAKKWQVLGLVVALVLVYVTAALGGLGSMNAQVFYRDLTLPSWAPPGWLFGPVWTLLYTMMGVAAWLVWRTPTTGTKPALILFVAHLAVNALWSWLFFAWYLGAVSFLWIVLLWGMIVALIRLFWPLNRLASLLLIPYLAWVSFASVLNFTIWQLNPGVL